MILPSAVTELATFDRGEAGGEGSEEQRCRHPERQLGGAASGTIGSGLCFGDDVVHAFLRIHLAYSRLGRYEARNVGSVGCCKIVFFEAGSPKPQNLGTRPLAVPGWG